jgi:hypothetical protein
MPGPDFGTMVIRRPARQEKRLPYGKYFVDQNTPRGEDAILYELKPYGGRREINRQKEFLRWEK